MPVTGAAEIEKPNSRRHVEPLIQGLLQRLPKKGEAWPEAARKEWLAALEVNLKLIYPEAKQASAPSAVPQTRAV
jgi:hypothetical protein